MAIATTGPLALNLTIRAEELVKNSSLPATDISTREISESAGFVEPDAFSEFYGYSSAILPTMGAIVPFDLSIINLKTQGFHIKKAIELRES